jgi:hypothetical protein
MSKSKLRLGENAGWLAPEALHLSKSDHHHSGLIMNSAQRDEPKG